jgi:hypothetical protein
LFEVPFFHIENWYSIHSVIRTTLKLLGLYRRGRKNAEQIQIRHNHVGSKRLPKQFDGFTLLHISDLHADISEGAMRRLNEIVLHEVSLIALRTRRSSPECSSSAAQFGVLDLRQVRAMSDRLPLDLAWISFSMMMEQLSLPKPDSGAWRRRTPQGSTL